MLLIRFVHFLGMALWIGGMVAAMVLSVSARSATGAERNAAFRWAGRLYSLVVGPGALLTVVTGLVLTMSLAQRAGSQVMAQPSMRAMWVEVGSATKRTSTPATSPATCMTQMEGWAITWLPAR